MNEFTDPPSVIEELIDLSRVAETIQSQLDSFQARHERAGLILPQDVLQGLRQFNAKLITLRESVTAIEGERRSLRVFAEIGHVVNSSLDLSTVLNEVIDTIIQLTGAERVFLMLRNARDEMEIYVARNWEKESLRSCLLYTSPSPRDRQKSRMPSSA